MVAWHIKAEWYTYARQWIGLPLLRAVTRCNLIGFCVRGQWIYFSSVWWRLINRVVVESVMMYECRLKFFHTIIFMTRAMACCLVGARALPDQSGFIVNWTLKNKAQGDFNDHTIIIFIINTHLKMSSTQRWSFCSGLRCFSVSGGKEESSLVWFN